ncbi:Transposon Tf2-8 polyprotein [Frankliniella fusca]|uniref:RNA-directed DNA polymerase n=1 Tax=Frankliniella fusca TaxID=407009 RepID=A0AAE1I1Z5_9NEOP|nr:Transposon Tf2-8 polyprotein [Frankliniella fusca]
MGSTEQEHDETVKKVIQKAKEVNAKFNATKLQFKKSSVKFMGQIISSKGMSINPKDVEAKMALKPPKNRDELYKLRGTINYVRRYVPEMARLMKPLDELTKQSVEYQWLPIHDKALSDIKKKIMEAPSLVPFNPNKKSIMQCDASKSGLECCLFQDYGEGQLKLIACASRKLNEAEVNYSQSEKELLSICFATKKFHEMIYGSHVVVETDHKPLIPIMKKAICKIGSVRLQRLRLKLLKYSLELKYVPGKYLYFADTLSRATVNETEHDEELLDMVHSISKHLLMSEKRKEQFRAATTKDTDLNIISNYYFNGWPEWKYVDDNVKGYYNVRSHIYVEAGLVFIDNLIIVPKSLRQYVMTTVHTGHLGVNKSIAKARQMFFWPEMSKDIRDFTSKCRPCEKYQPCNYKEYIKPHEVQEQRK